MEQESAEKPLQAESPRLYGSDQPTHLGIHQLAPLLVTNFCETIKKSPVVTRGGNHILAICRSSKRAVLQPGVLLGTAAACVHWGMFWRDLRGWHPQQLGLATAEGGSTCGPGAAFQGREFIDFSITFTPGSKTCLHQLSCWEDAYHLKTVINRDA